jgi:hypothetical protein
LGGFEIFEFIPPNWGARGVEKWGKVAKIAITEMNQFSYKLLNII